MPDLFQAVGEIAIVIDGIDHGTANRVVAWLESRELELPRQVLLQGLCALIGEFLGAIFVSTPGCLRRTGALFCPRVVGDLDFRGRLRLAHFRCLLGVVGRCRLETAGRSLRHFVQRLEHHVVFERFADVSLEVKRRQLQKADRLLELRGHRQLLTQPELQRRFEHRELSRSLRQI